MELKMVFRVILSLSIIIMASHMNAQEVVIVNFTVAGPGASSCTSYTPVSRFWDFFSQNCYLRYTRGTRGSPAPFKCAYMNIGPNLENILPRRIGRSSLTRTFTSTNTQTTTTYEWIQPDPSVAVVNSLDLGLYQQQQTTVIKIDAIVASNADGYVMIRCPTQLLASCQLPSDMFICTYQPNAPSTAVDGLTQLAGAAGVDIYNIASVDQNCN